RTAARLARALADRHGVEHALELRRVVALPGREHGGQRQAPAVGHEVKLGRKTATRPPQRMIRRLIRAAGCVGAPFFRAPAAEREARTLVESTQKADQSMSPSRSRSRWR